MRTRTAISDLGNLHLVPLDDGRAKLVVGDPTTLGHQRVGPLLAFVRIRTISHKFGVAGGT